MGNKNIELIQNNIKDTKFELKVIGWNSIPIALEVMRRYFPNAAEENESITKFLRDTNLKLIIGKSFLRYFVKDEFFKNIINIPEVKKRILICQNIEKFKFVLMRFNIYITFSLNISEESGFGPYFIISNKSKYKAGALEIFEEIFDYYSKNSILLSDILGE